jgi:hypothetical protein
LKLSGNLWLSIRVLSLLRLHCDVIFVITNSPASVQNRPEHPFFLSSVFRFLFVGLGAFVSGQRMVLFILATWETNGGTFTTSKDDIAGLAFNIATMANETTAVLCLVQC